MKNIFTLLVLFVSISCFSQDAPQNYHEMLKTYYKNTVPIIQPSELYKKILKGEKIYLLDTRENKEYSVSKIAGAIQVGYDKFDISSTSSFKKDVTIIVYCTIGARSETIGERLINKGFTSVYNLYGGMMHWKNQGYPIVDNSNHETENIHVYSKEWGKWLLKGKAIY